MRRVYFAGASSHTTLGADLDSAVANLGTLPSPVRAALRENPLAHLDGPALEPTTAVAGDAPYLLLANAPLLQRETRLYTILERIITIALDDACLTATDRRRTALFVGTSSADMSSYEARYQRELRSGHVATALSGACSIANLSRDLCRSMDLHGPDYTFNTACTASANALLTANEMVRSGRIDHALLVSVEVFNAFTVAGFKVLGLLAPTLMRPFDCDRQGLTLGEGCSALVVSAKKPPDRALSRFHLRAGANLCDTYSISAANRDGTTVAAVMRAALQQAGLEPHDVSAVKAHGTASLHNDEAEAAGLTQVFGASLPPVCALKPYLGHTLGACGLNELLLFCGAAAQRFVPGTPGIASEARADLGIALTQSARPLDAGNFMLNYFGFGGNNTCLIVSNQED